MILHYIFMLLQSQFGSDFKPGIKSGKFEHNIF